MNEDHNPLSSADTNHSERRQGHNLSHRNTNSNANRTVHHANRYNESQWEEQKERIISDPVHLSNATTLQRHRRVQETPFEAYYRVALAQAKIEAEICAKEIAEDCRKYGYDYRVELGNSTRQINLKRLSENRHILDESFKSHSESDWADYDDDENLPVFHCKICGDWNGSIGMILILECNHLCCTECLNGMFEPKLRLQNDPNVTNTTCPFDGCNHVLTRQEVRCFLRKDQLKIYDYFYLLQKKKEARRNLERIHTATSRGVAVEAEAYYRVAVEEARKWDIGYVHPTEDVYFGYYAYKTILQTNLKRLSENRHILDESFKNHSDWTESAFIQRGKEVRTFGFGEIEYDGEANWEKLPEFDCPICFRSFTVFYDVLIFECHHFWCRDCLEEMMQTKLETRNVTNIPCPFKAVNGCKHILTHQEIQCILKQNDFQRYDQYLLEKTLDAARDCKPCPAVNCGNAIFGVKDLPMVRCPRCRLQFCFNCLEQNWHHGVTCQEYQRWKEENGRGDAAFEQWRREHGTKQCPQCSVTIEKNEGCDHMTCKACAHEFSWTTLQSWGQVIH